MGIISIKLKFYIWMNLMILEELYGVKITMAAEDCPAYYY